MQKTCKFNFYNTQRAKEGGKAHWGQANAGELFWKFFVNVDKRLAKTLSGQDRDIMESILRDFALKNEDGM